MTHPNFWFFPPFFLYCLAHSLRARAHRKIPQLLGKKSECVPNDFVSEAVMILFYFISPVVLFTTVILCARELLTLRFPKRISRTAPVNFDGRDFCMTQAVLLGHFAKELLFLACE